MVERESGSAGRLALAGAGGVAFWVATQSLALGMAGAGHGWIIPFWVSLPLVLLYPLAAVRALGSGERRMRLDAGMLSIAIALDLLLLLTALGEEGAYFLRMWSLSNATVTAWIALWAGWQALALTSLLRRAAAGSRLAGT